MSSRAHLVATPKWILGIRITQLVLAVLLMGLEAFLVYYVAFSVLAFGLSTVSCTIIVLIWYLVATTSSPSAYNMWAVLALDIFLVIMWTVAFSLLSALTAAVAYAYSNYYYDSSCYYYYSYSCYRKRSLESSEGLSKRDVTYYAYWGVMVCASVLSALQAAFYVTTLITHGVLIHRHRKAGLPQKPVKSGHPPPSYTGGQSYEMTEGKSGTHFQTQSVPVSAPTDPFPTMGSGAHAAASQQVSNAVPGSHQQFSYGVAPQGQVPQGYAHPGTAVSPPPSNISSPVMQPRHSIPVPQPNIPELSNQRYA